MTFVSQVPQMPSVQEKETLAQASSSTSRMVSPGARQGCARCGAVALQSRHSRPDFLSPHASFADCALRRIAKVGTKLRSHMRTTEIDP